MGRWHQIVEEALCHQLATLIIGKFLEQCGPDTMCNAAKGHAADNRRVDHRAAIMPNGVGSDFRFADNWIKCHKHQMKFK